MDMDVSSVLNSLSEADISRLRETAAALLGNAGTQTTREPAALPAEPAVNMQWMQTAARMAGLFQQRDPRSDLLYALKPFLSETRRSRADQAAMMLKMLAIVDGIRRDRHE